MAEFLPQLGTELKSVFASAGAVANALSGGTLIICLAAGTFGLHDEAAAWPRNMLSGAAGAAGGWLVGILISPWGEVEEKKFTGLSKAFGGFLTGYIFSNVQRIAEWFGKEHFVTELATGRWLIFLGSFLVCAVLVFASRWHGLAMQRSALRTRLLEEVERWANGQIAANKDRGEVIEQAYQKRQEIHWRYT